MAYVSPKKHFGQHFLRDENIAKKIVSSLKRKGEYKTIIEVGPGTGMLTKYLLQQKEFVTFVVEIDRESITYLRNSLPQLENRIIEKDFLEFIPEWLPTAPQGRIGLLRRVLRTNRTARSHWTPSESPSDQPPFAIIGNFPYNISSQILFKVLEYRNQIPEVVGMFQKEVAERIASPPGNKTYGILSVLMQAYYKIEYLFTVHEHVFHPPPKVKSAVIRLTRNDTKKLDCDEEFFFKIVKAGFNQRRKTLRNALSSKFKVQSLNLEILSKRAEQLSVNDFIELTKMIST